MARGINKVILIGNLGRDPEVRYTQDQRPVTNFSVATSDQWRDRNTQEMQERTEWHSVVCFARLAEIASEYLRKGSKVYIEGRLQTRSWEQDGQTRYRTEVVANEMQMLDSRGSGMGGGMSGGPGGGQGMDAPQQGGGNYGGQRSGGYSQSRPMGGGRNQPQPPPVDDLDDFEDDIPF